MTGNDNNKISRQNRLRKLLLGIDQYFLNVTAITLGGVVYAPAALKQLIQTDIDASDASVKARADLSTEVQVERNSHAKVDPVLRLFKFYVVTQFGDSQDASSTLADFGISPRKSTQKTVATKAEAVGKLEATRAARHTMGPKQKAKIKGTVPTPNASGSQPTAGGGAGSTPTPKPTTPTP